VVKVYGVAVRPDRGLFERLHGASREHVVGLLEWGEHTDAYGTPACWEVMEYVEGGSLATLIKTEGPALGPDLVKEIVAQIAVALTHLHRDLTGPDGSGLTHRDIKPANVLVRKRSPLELVLCDFGLVTAVRESSHTGHVGTVAYQAPETWRRQNRQPAQDWWSLGVMVVEMLTGRNPNAGPDGAEPVPDVLFDHLSTHDVDVSDVTDPRWRRLCRGLLTRTPEDRWGSTEVHAWLDGAEPRVRADINVEREPEPSRRPAARTARHSPHEFAGRWWSNPHDLATAMADEWEAAREVFSGPRREDLGYWLIDEVGDVTFPSNLVRRLATTREEADERIVAFVAHFAPDIRPRFQGHFADTTGIAETCERAITGDDDAMTMLSGLTQPVVRSLAKHRCRAGHVSCGGPGCSVLADAWAAWVEGASALDQAVQTVIEAAGERAELASVANPQQGAGSAEAEVGRASLDASVAARAVAVLWRAVMDPSYIDKPCQALQKKLPSAERPAWWQQLHAQAQAATGPTRAALCLLLIELAAPAAAVTAADNERRVKEEERRAREEADRRLSKRRSTVIGIGFVPGLLALLLVPGLIGTSVASDTVPSARVAAWLFSVALALVLVGEVLLGIAMRRAETLGVGAVVAWSGALAGILVVVAYSKFLRFGFLFKYWGWLGCCIGLPVSFVLLALFAAFGEENTPQNRGTPRESGQ
jgi:hypothetical protein